jgi:signal transduction histidine kinase
MRPLLQHFTELNIKLYDGKEALRENLIYEKGLPRTAQTAGEQLDLRADRLLSIGGVWWRLSIIPGSEFGSQIEEQHPYLILLSGIVLSLLLFLIVANTIKRRITIAEELERTKALERKKDEFMTIASHELKTPLTGIKSTVQLLERSGLTDRDRTLLSKTSKNIEKLQKLISDLLDVSKIHSGQLKLNMSSFTLAELLNESIENVEHIHPTYTIIKKNEIPNLRMHGDKYRLDQAINNLLLNAIKYSPATDRVFVNTLISDNLLRIEITDEGIGIDKPDQKRIFERFFRAETLSPVISGLGMGLYIANEIVQRHNGVIGVESEPGKGSTFYIILPLGFDEEDRETEWGL